MSIPDLEIVMELHFQMKSKSLKISKSSFDGCGICCQKFNDKLGEQQEVLMNIADMINTIYLCESTLLRILKVSQNKLSNQFEAQKMMLQVLVYDSCDKMNVWKKYSLFHCR